MDEATFRAIYPEFRDVNAYPAAQVAFWLTASQARLDALRWGDMLDQGTALFMAHNIAISHLAGRGVAGSFSGPTASKSVGGASISYDTNSSTIEGAGAYNLTSYGKQFWDLAMMVGAGGVQL